MAGWVGCAFLCTIMTGLSQAGSYPLTFKPVKLGPLIKTISSNVHVSTVRVAFSPDIKLVGG